jgi:hypothetical protein
MNYSLEFVRAKYRILINDSEDIGELKKIANILLDGYIDQRNIGEKMIGNSILNAPMVVAPGTL